MSHSENGYGGDTLRRELPRNMEEETLGIGPVSSMHGFQSLLIDLCAAFASANGVKPDFYFAAGKAIVAAEMVAVDEAKGIVLRGEEDQFFRLLMELRHPRGAYVARLVSNRICRFCDQVNELGGAEFLRTLTGADAATVEKLLLPLFGVGPGFVSVYCLLAGVGRS